MMGKQRLVPGDQGSGAPAKSGSFASDVVTLASGTMIAQIIAIATSPIITRIYGAEAYGVAALVLSIAATIAVIACLRYEYSILLPRSDEEAANLLALSLLICLLMGLVLIPVMMLFGNDLASLLNAPEISPFLWVVPAMVFLLGSFSAINYWNSRKREYGRLSRTQVATAVSTAGTKLAVGLAGYPSGGALVGAQVIGQVVASSTLGYQAWRTDGPFLRGSVRWEGIRAGLHRYRNFPLFDSWSALLNTFALEMPIFILSAFFTSTIVGYYSLGLMILQLPLTFVGSTIGQVFFQRSAKALHEGRAQLAMVVENTVSRLVLWGFPLILLIAIIGREAFMVVFGADWAEAGVYAQILSFWILVSFVYAPISGLFSILDKLKIMLLLNIAMFVIRSGLLALGGVYQDVYLALMLFSASGGLLLMTVGGWILRESGVSLLGLLRSISRPLSLGLLLLAAVALLEHLLDLEPLLITLVGAAAIVPYYYIQFSRDGEIRSLVYRYLHRGEAG